MCLASPRLAPDGRAPVRFAMDSLRRNLLKQLVELIFPLPRAQQQTAVHASQLQFGTFGEPKLLGVRSGNANRQTISPFANSCVHGRPSCFAAARRPAASWPPSIGARSAASYGARHHGQNSKFKV